MIGIVEAERISIHNFYVRTTLNYLNLANEDFFSTVASISFALHQSSFALNPSCFVRQEKKDNKICAFFCFASIRADMLGIRYRKFHLPLHCTGQYRNIYAFRYSFPTLIQADPVLKILCLNLRVLIYGKMLHLYMNLELHTGAI
jgi:hypothetical protein